MILFPQNTKMKKSSETTLNFPLPAGMTCPNFKHCYKGCYARQGWYPTRKVKDPMMLRYAITQQDDFVEIVCRKLKFSRAKRIRLHDSGDFYSEKYLDKWIEIAKQNPHIKFYTYTKMVAWVKKRKLPENFIINFSLGGTEDHLIDLENDRHSRVFENMSQLKKSGYTDATETDDPALGPDKRLGIIYHGQRDFKNTRWAQVS